MFKRKRKKKYFILFTKSQNYINDSLDSWKEITDGEVINILLELKNRYNFDIVSFKIRDSFSTSKIVIKCDRDKIYEIFKEFITPLSKHICDVRLV